MFVHAAAAAAFVAIGTVAVAQAAGSQQPGFQSEPARIAFTDAAGTATELPLLDISGAYPGMDPQRTVIRLRNIGEIAQTFTVAAAVHPTGPRSLDRVLRVRVTDRTSGATLYVGRLSALRFEGSTLQAGRSASYVVQVSWPETPRDDAYQGAPLSLELTAEAVAA